jgi:hypothetical protein
MKKIILFVTTFITLAAGKAVANDSCQILFNKQVIFKGGVDQEDAIAAIVAKEIRNTDRITIIYHTDDGNKGWKRTFYLEDSTGQNVKTIELGKQSGTVIVNASVLAMMKQKKKPILISTMSLPTDKSLAARIRVRRVFICKIAWN